VSRVTTPTPPSAIASNEADRARATSAHAPPGPSLPAAAQAYLIWRWPFAYLQRCRDRYGSSFTHRMTGFPPLVFLSDPAEIRAAFAAPDELLRAGEGAVTTAPIVGPGSFMLDDGEEHAATRRQILPSLHEKIVQRHEQTIAEVTRRALLAWPRDVPFELHAKLRALTLEVILRKTFASSPRVSDEELRRLRDALLAMLEITGSSMFPEPILRHGPGRATWRRFLRDRAEADELVYTLIDQRRGGGEADGEDLLGVLSSRGEGQPRPSARQVRDNLMSLVLAGHETTAAQLSWTFQLLAHNPAVLSRLVAEIERGEDDEYLTAVIREVLRHRPVFLFAIPRAVSEAVELGGRIYRRPMQLLSCIYLVHHDPSLFPDPEVFRPERFLSKPPEPHLWIPWGGGRKRCPGLHLAMLEMKTVLRGVLSSVTVEPASRQIERPRWRSVIVTPHAGSRVVLRPRARRSLRVSMSRPASLRATHETDA
jgi:cytochrome P450